MDFNRDGKREIAVGSLNGEFYILDDSLRVLSTWLGLRIMKNLRKIPEVFILPRRRGRLIAIITQSFLWGV
jgi:hypothetical protein